jgi:steroid delta-isomerase-like uncharacterized protein
MLPTKEVSRIVQERFSSFEAGDMARVLALYADDASFWDTKSAGRMSGKAELAGYLGNLLKRFSLRYALLEEHRLDGQDGAIALWECALRRRRDDGTPAEDLLLQRGMNIIQLKDGLICREESYADMAMLERLAAID